jgi:hypothetical protein
MQQLAPRSLHLKLGHLLFNNVHGLDVPPDALEVLEDVLGKIAVIKHQGRPLAVAVDRDVAAVC